MTNLLRDASLDFFNISAIAQNNHLNLCQEIEIISSLLSQSHSEIRFAFLHVVPPDVLSHERRKVSDSHASHLIDCRLIEAVNTNYSRNQLNNRLNQR